MAATWKRSEAEAEVPADQAQSSVRPVRDSFWSHARSRATPGDVGARAAAGQRFSPAILVVVTAVRAVPVEYSIWTRTPQCLRLLSARLSLPISVGLAAQMEP